MPHDLPSIDALPALPTCPNLPADWLLGVQVAGWVLVLLLLIAVVRLRRHNHLDGGHLGGPRCVLALPRHIQRLARRLMLVLQRMPAHCCSVLHKGWGLARGGLWQGL